MASESAFIGQTFPDGPGKDMPLGPLARTVWPQILRLYGGVPKAVDFEIYAPNAVFEDPLMRAQGVPQIKSAFYSLAKLFKVAKIVEYKLEEKEDSPGTGKITVVNKQHYETMGRSFDTDTTIIIEMSDGKVVLHEDRWNSKPLSGWARGLRRVNMVITHGLMGFGKDPKEAL